MSNQKHVSEPFMVSLDTAEYLANPNEHYQGDVEPIELMQAQMTKEEFVGFLKGNIIKYCSRLGKKDNPTREAVKIAKYSQWLEMAINDQKINPRE